MILPIGAFQAHFSPKEFVDFLRKPEPAFRVEIKLPTRGSEQLALTSQIWQGKPWHHTILFRQPEAIAAKGTAILLITGDGPREGDFSMLSLVTASTGMPTAMLFDIPNQPLYGMKEDDLIAHTFERYFETKDSSWPLLFPMAKSAIKAMDAIVAHTARTKNPIKKFVVTGASKRGWTTWFVGASGDNRVIGIAPMVYDNLKLNQQMKHQIDSWGDYSEQIQDYTRRGLQQKLESPEGRHLAEIVDPYSYRARIKVPTLIVNGANDPYWTVDALSQYWNDLTQPHWCSIVPNAGHSLGTGLQAVGAVGAFARSLAGAFKMPNLSATFEQLPSRSAGLGDSRVVRTAVDFGVANPVNVTVWTVSNTNTDFRKGTWKPAITRANPTGKELKLDFAIPRSLPTAALVECRYRIGNREFILDCPVKVFKP